MEIKKGSIKTRFVVGWVCWRDLFVFCCRLLEERMLIEDLEHDEFSVMSKHCNRDRPKGIN